MQALMKERSRLTGRYQTTIPASVRNRLRLKKGDEIEYEIAPDGRVYLTPARVDEADPALGGFLDLLEADIMANPGKLAVFGGGLRDRMASLVGDIEIDLDAPLSDDDE
jgi:antitoxin PrlF